MEHTFILVLTDDDEDEHLFFTEAVEEMDSSNISLELFKNGELLLEWLKSDNSNPDLLFLDINMPLLGGFECLQEIRTIEKYKDLPVIIYSTSLHPHDVTLAYTYGANLYLSKVVAIKNLTANLTKIIDAVKDNKLSVLKDFLIPAF
jgi:CheY-like chemotaxis protein